MYVIRWRDIISFLWTEINEQIHLNIFQQHFVIQHVTNMRPFLQVNCNLLDTQFIFYTELISKYMYIIYHVLIFQTCFWVFIKNHFSIPLIKYSKLVASAHFKRIKKVGNLTSDQVLNFIFIIANLKNLVIESYK